MQPLQNNRLTNLLRLTKVTIHIGDHFEFRGNVLHRHHRLLRPQLLHDALAQVECLWICPQIIRAA